MSLLCAQSLADAIGDPIEFIGRSSRRASDLCESAPLLCEKVAKLLVSARHRFGDEILDRWNAVGHFLTRGSLIPRYSGHGHRFPPIKFMRRASSRRTA